MRVKLAGFITAGLLITLLLAGVVSSFASGDPDGLDSASQRGCSTDSEGEVTGGDCMAQSAKDHEIGGPLADYGIAGIGNEFLSTAISGIAGSLLVFGIGAGVFWLVRRRDTATESQD